MTFLNSSHLNETLLQTVRTAENISALQKTLLSLPQQLRASHACGPAQGIHLTCSVPTCTCVLFWCCPNNFGDTQQCTVGLCKKHFKLAIHDLPHGTFTVGNYGPTLPTPSVPTARKQHRIQDNHNDPSDEDDTDDDYDQIVTFSLDCHPPVDEEADEQPQDLYPIGNTNQMENVCPLATSTDIVPLFMTENSSTTSQPPSASHG
ncbi:hypothetical protein E2C01_070669 [Portunus trituberculatus]|uniref:Uncharacterized protein n=1 Tax=Portunus trituberculatus TaxID=210409 RepID=A0A5B7HXX5_PORTR|nr:hypothetical protein [Portunus trituberculatus]